MSVQLKTETQRIPQLTMPPSTLMMSPGGSTGIFRRATPSTPMSQEMCLSPRALPPLHRFHEDKKKHSIGMSFSKKWESCSTPARHAANPYQSERHADAQEKLKHYILSTRP